MKCFLPIEVIFLIWELGLFQTIVKNDFGKLSLIILIILLNEHLIRGKDG